MPTGTRAGEYDAASTGVAATPPTWASEEMPHRYRSKRKSLASSANRTAWMIRIDRPQARYHGADAMPSKLLCEARIATMKISIALAIFDEPGKRASGVC